MNKFRKILCIIDFEGDADDAIQQANLFARNHNSDMTFLAVSPSIDRNTVLFPQFHEELAMAESNLANEIANNLSERIATLTGRSASEFQVISESGSEVAAASRIAEELAADLVVVSDTALKRSESWFGDIASRIVRCTHCSVLLTRSKQGAGCIVAATDFSDPAFPAVEAAALEAQLRNFHLVLVHSLRRPKVAAAIPLESASMGMIQRQEFKAQSHRAHEQLMHVLETIGDIGEPVVSAELPADAIVRLAKERRADLVVVGTLGRSGIPRLVMGSTAEAVIDNAPCSVLVVRLH